MKKRLEGLIAGVLIGATITGGTVFAINTTTLYDVLMNGIKIVIDGQQLNPTDANGNRVEPIIYNGTTYLPVRAVANVFGKAVYWDGPNYTVYLGDMNGELEYSSVSINDVDNIGDTFKKASSDSLVDNYGNSYSYAIYGTTYGTRTYQTLLNMKYSKFKGTIYVPKGSNASSTVKILIKCDGKVVYTSPEITKSSYPIKFNVDIKGCNDFQIEFSDSGSDGKTFYIGDAGFYQ